MSSFQIVGLPAAPFAPLFSLSDAELSEIHAQRVVATSKPGYPCRVSLIMSVRIYDALDWMMDATVCPGAESAAVIERMFADPRVAYIHLHNANRGCFSCAVRRTSGGAS
jgi:hypothetical protein